MSRLPIALTGKTLIVHRGFPANWLAELLKQPGGGSYLRVDIRQYDPKNATPTEKVIQDELLPLNLPIPFMAKITAEHILLRHLNKDNKLMLPFELLALHNEIEQRFHLRYTFENGRIFAGMAVAENQLEYEI